jgi:nucleotide-binding universal stress UspA family protein
MPKEQIFKKILVSTDGSHPSTIAQELTASIAKKLDSKVTVIHVIAHENLKHQLQRYSSDYGFVPTGPSGFGQSAARVTRTVTVLPEALSNDIDNWYHQKGEKAIRDAETLFKEQGIRVDKKIVEHADPADTVIKEAKNAEYDLIVVGQSGEDEETVHLGSIAEKISRNSQTSVLIAREKVEISKILVPIDGSERSEEALEYAVSLGKNVDAKITLLYVQEFDFFDLKPEMAKDIGNNILSSAAGKVKGVKVDKKLESGDPAKVIIQVAKKGNYDLIVMGSKGQGTIQRLLLGSVSDHVIHYTDRSVLLVR